MRSGGSLPFASLHSAHPVDVDDAVGDVGQQLGRIESAVQEIVGKTVLGIDLGEQPRWG